MRVYPCIRLHTKFSFRVTTFLPALLKTVAFLAKFVDMVLAWHLKVTPATDRTSWGGIWLCSLG